MGLHYLLPVYWRPIKRKQEEVPSTFPDLLRNEKTTLRKLYFQFLSHWMVYNRGDSFPFDFERNGIPFGSKSKGKLSPRSYPIQCERNWKYSFLSVQRSEVQLSERLASLGIMGRPIEGPPETLLEHHNTIWYWRVLRSALNRAPRMESDRRWEFSESNYIGVVPITQISRNYKVPILSSSISNVKKRYMRVSKAVKTIENELFLMIKILD